MISLITGAAVMIFGAIITFYELQPFQNKIFLQILKILFWLSVGGFIGSLIGYIFLYGGNMVR